MEDPVTVKRPRSHAVESLFAVLLALVLRNASEQVFNELAVTVFAEFECRGFKDAARFADRCTKFEMGLNATG